MNPLYVPPNSHCGHSWKPTPMAPKAHYERHQKLIVSGQKRAAAASPDARVSTPVGHCRLTVGRADKNKLLIT